jgi:tRNA (mo5U34)-methyltransferase
MNLRKLLRQPQPRLPLTGHEPSPVPVPAIDRLRDDDLQQLNSLLKWNCYTVDSLGRRFGDCARAGKRELPQPIPDRRIALFDQASGLAGRSVLEVGCFEGVHTIGLAQAGARVTAVDARMENVVKTMLRCQFYGVVPDVRRCDVEVQAELDSLPEVDLLHHVGVLYHLVDPVRHLQALAPKVRRGLMLDTHVATAATARHTLLSGGRSWPCQRYAEGGVGEVFSGMYDHAAWMVLEDLLQLLVELGFSQTRVHEHRDERNGPRVLIFANRDLAA